MNYLKCSLVTGALIALMMGVSGAAMANSDEEQLKRMADPDQWPAPGRDFSLTRHSTLAEINTGNVNKLQMIWLQGTNALRGHEGQPLVIKDVGGKTMLFMVSGCPAMSNCNVVQALDLTDPDNPKPGTARPLVQTPATEMYPALSSDGKWLAYGSNETGQNEIYVMPYQGGSGKWQISVNGGRWALWAPNGKSLYFQSKDNHIMVADIASHGDAITHSQPRQWSPVAVRNAGDNLSYAIHPDGQHILVFPVAEPSPEEKGNAHVTFVFNFADELRRKLSAAK